MRLDKFLKVSRVIKRRTVANEACDNGRVSINGRPAKAGTQVKVGDMVTVEFAGGSTKFEILAVEENVKKANATEMYRIITSLILAVFITVGAITGFSGCEKEVDTELTMSYVMTVGDSEIYEEQFCYLFSAEAKAVAGRQYSEKWLKENKEDVLKAAADKATEIAVLYNYAQQEGITLTDEEVYKIKSNLISDLLYNLELNQDDKIETNDEICLELTGMNVKEYLRFATMKATAEKALASIMGDYTPDEELLEKYYQTNKDDFMANEIGLIYTKDKSVAKEVMDLLTNNTYSFDVVAKGWSERGDVLENGGVMVVTAENRILPTKVVKWAVSNVPDSDSYEMIEVENDGYYILTCRDVLSYEDSYEVRAYVSEALIKEEQSTRIGKIAEDKNLSKVNFNKDKALKVVNKFLEGRGL